MKLFVGNLSWSATEEEIRPMFEQYGEVTSLKIITDPQTGRSRGFCFVEMASKEAGDEAIRNLDNSDVAGRQIRVSEARNDNRGGPRGERRPFDGNRRGGGDFGGGQRRYPGFQNNSRGFNE